MFPKMSVDTDMRDFYIDLAESMTYRGFFRTEAIANYAVALRAMHNYALDTDISRRDGEAGHITGKTEGNVSIRYWNKVEKGRYSDLQMTKFGQRLLALIKAQGGAVSIAYTGSPVVEGDN
jgi:hypothetical protein